ncbi:MAG: TetR/AcrR family transcriptional regulator, partial [Myxococcota bacterium]
MTARKHDPEATRAAILQAAEALFVERGFAAVSLSEISKSSGVTKSLIHHYFGSKDELYREVQRRSIEEYFVRQIEMIRDETREDRTTLRDSVEMFFRFHQDNPQVSRLMCWSELEGVPHPCTDLELAVTREGIARIARGQEAGILRADIAPEHILSMFLTLVSRWFMFKPTVLVWADRTEDDPAEADERYLHDLLKVFFEG